MPSETIDPTVDLGQLAGQLSAPSPIPPNPFYLLLPGGGKVPIYQNDARTVYDVDICDASGSRVTCTDPRAAGLILHPDVAGAIWRG